MPSDVWCALDGSRSGSCRISSVSDQRRARSERGLVALRLTPWVGQLLTVVATVRSLTGLATLVAAEAATLVAVAAGGLATLGAVAALIAVPATLVAAEAAALATLTALATRGPGDRGGRVTQRRADLVDLQLDDRTTLALLGLVAALPQPALHQHPHALAQRLGDVLGRLAPHGAVEEQGVAVLPLAGLPVERPRRGGHGEVRDGRPGGEEGQLGIGGEVSDDGDDGFASHEGSPVEIVDVRGPDADVLGQRDLTCRTDAPTLPGAADSQGPARRAGSSGRRTIRRAGRGGAPWSA
ncbi:hypothetical protein SDC9_72491 [bioreactor metagenome]|uniref:Uncharacterized protein n=1 Tax=bioreactor metagenome TaxID=1076179 RepID=A0A644YBW2_9ZZZZ